MLGYAPDADTDNLKVQDPARLGATRYPEDILHAPLVIEYDLRPADNVVMNFDNKIFFFLGIEDRNTLIPGTTYGVRTDCCPSPTTFVAVTVNR
jgi:hypothetical protein